MYEEILNRTLLQEAYHNLENCIKPLSQVSDSLRRAKYDDLASQITIIMDRVSMIQDIILRDCRELKVIEN